MMNDKTVRKDPSIIHHSALINPPHVLVEQSGVLATLSTWRSRVQIPSRALKWHGTPIRQSDGFQTSVDVGSTPSRAT